MKSNTGGDELAAALAGVAGSFGYYAEQQLDIALLGTNSDDIKLIGALVTRNWPWWFLLGFAAHCVNGALLGVVYAKTFNRFLPGPGWLRGLILAQIENFVLWNILIRVVDRHHPAIQSGDLPKYDARIPFWQGVLRHVAYGIVLGQVYGERGR